MLDDVTKELLDEVAKAAANTVVAEQAPNRAKEHNDIATRLIKWFLTALLLEAGIITLYFNTLHVGVNDRIQCNRGKITTLEHEHIRTSDFRPNNSCE